MTRHSRLTRFLLVLLALTLGTAMSACGNQSGSSSASSSAGIPLTVGLTYTPDIQFSPFYVAVQKGYFADEGLNVTLRHHGASESLMGALQSGTEDVVYAGGDEMLLSRSQGVDVVNFATMYQSHPAELIVPQGSSISSFADLRGHSIGIPGPFGENWYALLAMLRQAGLTQSDVNIQSIGYTQQAALMGNKVDAVVGFSNNDAVKFGQAGFPIREIRLDAATPLVALGLGASKATVTDKQDQLKAMMRALDKAVAYCTSDLDGTVALTEKYVPALSDDAQRAAARATLEATNKLYGSQLGKQDAQRWSDMATFMAESGIISKPVDAKESFVSLVG